MFTAVRPRPLPGWPPTRSPRSPRLALLQRAALLMPVTGGPALAAADAMLGEYGQWLAGLFRDVPGLAGTVLAQPSWSGGSGEARAEYLPPSGRLLLARRGDEAVGMAGLRPVEDRPGAAELKRLYVRRGHRGEGIARDLLHRLVGEARHLGYRELLLESSPRMADAVQLYRATGFEPVPSYRNRPADLDTHYLSMALALA